MVEVELDSVDLFRIQGWHSLAFNQHRQTKNDRELIEKVKVMYMANLKEEELDDEDHRDDGNDIVDDDGVGDPRTPPDDTPTDKPKPSKKKAIKNK